MYWIIFAVLAALAFLTVWLALSYPNVGIKIVAGLFLIILGVNLFGGLEYKSGESVTGSLTDYTYTTYDTLTTNGVGIIFVLLGLLVILFSPLEEPEYSEEED